MMAPQPSMLVQLLQLHHAIPGPKAHILGDQED
eukprot:CAMPEP_0117673774 /NCGR_PEP_ID=MMETSP0804-20121206/14661_1 /TAXON_ID=1074897 /ORGANISM="Tetraselmis astigmatica, Strain CCMP880" /LENGTH=32 /DNA_ID= /DNA_START= /DNA_END= /DNA_ORIENTATION=